MLGAIGINLPATAGPIAEYMYQWSIAFFYFKIFRQGLLSGQFQKVANERLPVIIEKMSHLTLDERHQVVRAYAECARRYRVSGHAEVMKVAKQLTRLLGLNSETGATGSTQVHDAT